MAARLIGDREAGTPPPIPDRDDDLESFWHVLLWVSLRHCEHRLHSSKVVDHLGSLFDHMYIGGTGQVEGGDAKRASMTSQDCIKDMKLRSNILHAILKNTTKPLAIRYSSDEELDDILEVQRMWEELGEENPTSNKKALRIELGARILQMETDSLDQGRLAWAKWRTIQDDPEWMEKIFENALNDPTVDWNTGSANIQRTLPRPSASKATKRKSDSNVDEGNQKNSST